LFVVVEEKRERTLTAMLSAKKKIRYEISELNDRLKQSKENIHKLKNNIPITMETDAPDMESLS
jgi:hypothetical protein